MSIVKRFATEDYVDEMIEVNETVLYTEQTLTEAQKAQARENIGAANEDITTYIDTSVTEYLKENPVAYGMSATVRNLLQNLLSAAVYTSDQSASIEMLSTILNNQSSISYDISNNLTYVTTNNEENSVMRGNAYIANLIAVDGFELVSVSITMGGTDITSTAYDGEGNIVIPSVTGAVVITAIAEEVEYFEFTGATIGYLSTNDENTGMMVIKDTQNRIIPLPLGIDLDNGATYRATIAPEYMFSVSTYSATNKDLDFSSLAANGGFWWRAGPRVIYSNDYINEYEFTATNDNEVVGFALRRADNAAISEAEYMDIVSSLKVRKV